MRLGKVSCGFNVKCSKAHVWCDVVLCGYTILYYALSVVMMVVVVVYCAEWRYNNITVLNINYILSHHLTHCQNITDIREREQIEIYQAECARRVR